MSRLSRVCRDGQPGDKHAPCMSCDCPCHDVPAPSRLRAVFEQTRAERRAAEERADGAA